MPWLRVFDGTYGLYFLVLMLAGPTLFPLAIAFALLSAFALLAVLPVAAVWSAVRKLPPRTLLIATYAGLILSLAYHIPAAVFVVLATVKDATGPADLLDYPMLSLLAGAAVTAAAAWFLHRRVTTSRGNVRGTQPGPGTPTTTA